MTDTTWPLAARRERIAGLDILRGVAMFAMIFYHANWDLSAYGLIDVDVGSDPPWKAFARLIAGTFLALVGFNLVLATRNGIRPWPYLRRLAIVGVAAIAVSVATYFFMPDSFIFFGILHHIFVASILALLFVWAPLWLIAVVAVFSLAAPSLLTDPFFDTPALLFLGLSANPQPTADYVPIFPWFGIVLAGVGLGRLFLDFGIGSAMAGWRPGGRLVRIVMFFGRWSLPIYLVHQPILLGALFLGSSLIGQSEESLANRYMNLCTVECRATGSEPAACQATCGCILTGARGAGILPPALSGTMTTAQSQSWQTIVEACLPKDLDPPAIGG